MNQLITFVSLVWAGLHFCWLVFWGCGAVRISGFLGDFLCYFLWGLLGLASCIKELRGSNKRHHFHTLLPTSADKNNPKHTDFWIYTSKLPISLWLLFIFANLHRHSSWFQEEYHRYTFFPAKTNNCRSLHHWMRSLFLLWTSLWIIGGSFCWEFRVCGWAGWSLWEGSLG